MVGEASEDTFIIFGFFRNFEKGPDKTEEIFETFRPFSGQKFKLAYLQSLKSGFLLT
jgi:hypothetical protein